MLKHSRPPAKWKPCTLTSLHSIAGTHEYLKVTRIATQVRRMPSQTGRRNFTVVKAAIDSNRWLLEEEETDAAKLALELESPSKRKYVRTLTNFTFERWATHRSTDRYLSHMKLLAFGKSSIIKGLAQPLLSVTAVSLLVCVYENLRIDGTVVPTWAPSLFIPQAPFDLTSFALSLLLVFRTNTSYDRWLESVTVWSNIANRSRDTVRQLISHLYEKDRGMSPLAAAMCRWVVAYARSLKCQLQENSALELELRGILSGEEIKQVMASHHAPSFALAVLTELAARAPLLDAHRIRLDENLTFFEDAVGACERLLKTPIPISYTRHTSRFMFIWLTALPLALWPACGWGTAPLAVVISFLLLGIEEIGVQIEEPFGYIPLEDLCDEIEGDVFSIIEEAHLTKKLAGEAATIALAGGFRLGEMYGDDKVGEEENTTSGNGSGKAQQPRSGLFQTSPRYGYGSRSADHREWEEGRGDDTGSVFNSMDEDYV